MLWDCIFRLLLAGVLGGVIGWDREYRAKEAGLRTHFLVALGSALIMIVSQYGFADVLAKPGYGLDPSRVAAQVVSGIGFIGAGTILIQKQFVRGLTTAAGLWATSGIGLAVGGGMYWIGVFAMILTLIGLEFLTIIFKNVGEHSSLLVFATTDKENLNEDITEAEEEIAAEEEEAKTAAADDEIEKLQAENRQLKEEFLRAYADAENTKKRCAQEIEKNNKYAISSFAKDLLTVADNLHRAIDAIGKDNSENCEALRKGVELTENELTKVFNKFGIKKMEIMDTVFDPNFHQVIQEVEDKEKPNGTIIAELQTGYMLNDRILREAMVVVTKGGK